VKPCRKVAKAGGVSVRRHTALGRHHSAAWGVSEHHVDALLDAPSLERGADVTIVCPYCERHCVLDGDTLAASESPTGYCRMYTVQDGRVGERFPHHYSSMHVSHIEAVPFYHFQPGSRTFMLGGASCNLDCQYCSNAYVARAEPAPLLYFELAPERIVALAQQHGCHNITFAVNEPTVAWPTLVELAQVAARAGLPLGVLTNGYVPAEIAEQMAQQLAFVSVSLKGFSDAFYQRYAGVPSVRPVLRTIEILSRRTHLEVVTPIVQSVNDEDIPAMADFIAGLDRNIPWHLFRLLPEYKMATYERPSIEALDLKLQQVREKLHFVYLGNFVGSQWVSTCCPACGALAIERISLGGCGAKAVAYHLQDGCCGQCGYKLPLAGRWVSWSSEDKVA